MTMAKTPVLIILNSAEAQELLKRALNGLLEIEKDYEMIDSQGHLDAFFNHTSPQLLVLDAFGTSVEAAEDFVRKQKDLRPDLKVWWYSVYTPRTPSLYDAVFDKGGDHEGSARRLANTLFAFMEEPERPFDPRIARL